MSNVSPGWYPDSNTPGQQRYWDGTQWTEHVAPMAAATPPPVAPGYGGLPTAPAVPYGYGAPMMGPNYAHWGMRLGGYLIDALCVVPFYIVAIIGLSIHHTTTDAYGYETQSTSGVGVAIAVIAYLALVAFAIWNQIIRQGRTGYSLGKQVLGIKLIKEATGQPLGAGLTFGRQICHVLDSLACYIGWLWPLWDAKKQTFADKLVSSIVIVEPKPKQ